jgi:hypothetical protein
MQAAAEAAGLVTGGAISVAAAKAGAVCTTVGAKATIGKLAYKCAINTKTKKLVWVKA